MKGTCKLCLKENMEMHKDSHIIPKSFYKRAGLFSEGGKMYYPDHSSGESNKWKDSNSNSGEYEQHIFCLECEKILKSYEDYGGDLLHNNLKEKLTTEILNHSDGMEFLRYSGIDYKKLKLFYLSIFWRASIASREIFDLQLEKNVEEDLRKMILEGNAGSFMDYPIRTVFHLKPNFIEAFHVAPPQFAEKGLYRFHFNDVFNSGVIIELITDVDLHLDRVAIAMTEDGVIDVDMLNEEESIDLYKNVIKLPGISDEVFEEFRNKIQQDNANKGTDYLKQTLTTYQDHKSPGLRFRRGKKKE